MTKRQTHLYLDPELKVEAKVAAARAGVSLSQYINALIREDLGKTKGVPA